MPKGKAKKTVPYHFDPNTLQSAATTIENLRQEQSDAAMDVASQYKMFMDKGGHPEAMKLCLRLRRASIKKQQDFLRAFQDYTKILLKDAVAQGDLFDGVAPVATATVVEAGDGAPAAAGADDATDQAPAPTDATPPDQPADRDEAESAPWETPALPAPVDPQTTATGGALYEQGRRAAESGAAMEAAADLSPSARAVWCAGYRSWAPESPTPPIPEADPVAAAPLPRRRRRSQHNQHDQNAGACA